MAWSIYPAPPPDRWRTAWDTWRRAAEHGLTVGPEPGPECTRKPVGRGWRIDRPGARSWRPPVVRDPNRSLW